MIAVPLHGACSSGLVAYVDEKDYPLVAHLKWRADRGPSTIYATASSGHYKSAKWVSMHALIMGKKDGLVVDHIDNNGLNNTRSNLRHVSRWQNKTRGRAKPSASGYRGVYRVKSGFRTSINSFRDGFKHYGIFETAEEAARHYDRVAYKLRGEFAHLNFPEELEEIKRDILDEPYASIVPLPVQVTP